MAGVGVWTLIEKHPSLVLLTSGLYDLTAYILILAGKGYITSDGGAVAEWSRALHVREKTKTKRSQVRPPAWTILKKKETKNLFIETFESLRLQIEESLLN